MNGKTININGMIKRLYWIDFLRGMAALSVLLWHYQVFYWTEPEKTILASTSSQPLFTWLWFFYLNGYMAVQLFWCISGFVFTYVYMIPFNVRGVMMFLLNRFSRLYPLHFITLLVVALLQIFSFLLVNHVQIYPFNDVFHFILNIFFASSWGFEKGFSFNAPIWSVSVEVIIYLLFVFSQRLMVKTPILSLLLTVIFLILYISKIGHFMFWRCAEFFYGGCFVFHFRKNFIAGYPKKNMITYLIFGFIGFQLSSKFEVAGYHFFSEAMLLLASFSLVLAAYIVDEFDEVIGKKIRVFGDMTYGSYLWHIPIQIIVIIFIEILGIDRSIFSHPLCLIAFLTAVFLAAYFSFKYIERPAQRYIRSIFQCGNQISY